MTKKREPKRRPQMTQVDQMTDAEVLIAVARESLKRYGTALPPAGSNALKPRVTVDWTKEIKVCPNCKESKLVLPDFGVVVRRGIERAQSWCIYCRARGAYENKPRTYNTSSGGPSRRRPAHRTP